MKLSKAVITMLILSTAFSHGGDNSNKRRAEELAARQAELEKLRRDYANWKFERLMANFNLALGPVIAGAAALGASHSHDMLKARSYLDPRVPLFRGFQRATTYGSLPFFYGSALFGAYLVSNSLLQKYYTSNTDFETRAKNYTAHPWQNNKK